MEGLISLKNKENACFKWCHIRFINPRNSHPEWINKQDKEIAKTLDWDIGYIMEILIFLWKLEIMKLLKKDLILM